MQAAKNGLNSPLTSSAGRLFDAAAAAAGFRRPVTFEGEAAMWLEGIADKTECGTYPIKFMEHDPIVVDPRALILEVAEDALGGTQPAVISARFHNSVAAMIAETSLQLAEKTGITTVGLTGGCFQNKLLTERTSALLRSYKFNVLLHDTIPPNDGGIALGQIVVALARHRKKSDSVL